MKLYEFEGHKIFSRVGIKSPFFVTCTNLDEINQAKKRLKFPIVAKVQVLSGKRGKGGGVKICKTEKQIVDFCKKHFGKEFSGEEISFINLVEKVEIDKELYASITYDTVLKIPFLLFSNEGGVDIEDVRVRDPDKILRVDINPTTGLMAKNISKIVGGDIKLADFLMRLWDAFARYDARLIEVNPIAKVTRSVILSPAQRDEESEYLAIDAKVILDDNGLARHRDIEFLPKGATGAIPTNREIEAKKIDEEDYRGSAGSTFIEFGGSPRSLGEAGDIAILASGGGASLLVMDAIAAAGGKPANYTEYSGNPPAEKVEKLTKITLAREGLSGCLVAGAVANFTDIYETLSGFASGLRQTKPKPAYPIVIRRGGPKQKEAYEMLENLAAKEGFDIHLFGPETPISVACKKMVELSESYKTLRNTR